jgi:hypothetical protein
MAIGATKMKSPDLSQSADSLRRATRGDLAWVLKVGDKQGSQDSGGEKIRPRIAKKAATKKVQKSKKK